MVDFQDYSFDAIFEDYVDNLSWVEDKEGNRWTPKSPINGLTHYTPGLGYNVRLKSGVTDIEVETFGKQRDYSQETVTIQPTGTWVGCPYKQPESLLNILKNQNIIAVYKKEGNSELVYLPQYPNLPYGWNNDRNVYPGKAYKFQSSGSPINFTFPAPKGALKIASLRNNDFPTPMDQIVQDVNLSMTIALPSISLDKNIQSGDRIRIYNSSNQCVGENIVNNAGSIVIVDGLNLVTGESLEIRYVDAKSNTEEVLAIKGWKRGDNVYEAQKIAIAEGEVI